MRLAILLSLFLAPGLLAQGPTMLDAKSKADLLATRELAWRAWFAGDHATLERMLPAEFIGIGWGDGPWSGKAETIASSTDYAAGGGTLSRLEFPRTDIQVYGEVAVVYSTYRVGMKDRAGQESVQEGRATEVFIRRGGKWLHPGWHLDSGR